MPAPSFRRCLLILVCGYLATSCWTSEGRGQERGARGARRNSEQEDKTPPPVERYMGRRVAQTMHYLGAEWLIRENREDEERCSLMLSNLGVKPGMTVCDMGCGNGFYALQMAKMVGPQGSVLAVDIQPEMLSFLRDRMHQQGVQQRHADPGVAAQSAFA